VFFTLHLVLFFEGMRSERQLERVGADRLSVRWYLGYDLHEPLPDHSSFYLPKWQDVETGEPRCKQPVGHFSSGQ